MAENIKPDHPAKPPRDLRQELTDKLVQTLEQGQIPWDKPYAALRAGLPRNMETGREYRGGNRLMLMLEQADRGYGDPRYGTVKQINALGGRVKKGERGLPVELWKEQPFYARKDISVTLNGMRVKVFGEKNGRAEVGMPTDKDATLHVKTTDLRVQRHTEQGPQHLSWDKARELDTWTSRVHTVFNVAQCEGLKLEPLAPAPTFDPVARGESLKAAMARDGLSYGEHPEHAFYSPKRDQVVLPPRGAFNSELGNEQGAARYYGTLLHEIGHATGAAHRLNREGITGGHRFGSEGYAKEELRAEMFSLFAAAQTGIPHDAERHAAYVQDWAKVLKNDKNEIFRAAAEAGKAVDYVLAKEQSLLVTQDRQTSVEVAERAADSAPQPEPTQGKPKTVEIDAPAHWASALVNRDESGLEPSEAACAKDWVEKQGVGYPASMSDPFMGRHEGLLTEMATYSFLVPEKDIGPSVDGRMQEAIQREDALLSKQPHELTFAEFATVATTQKLGPNHGREWAVFNGSVQRGELMGYAEGPTERDALRMMHKNRVNNALYDNMPDAVHPPGMEPKSMPPHHVLGEYPDLQEKFAPAIKEHRQMLNKEDRKASEYRAMGEPIAYEKAVQTFVNGGGNEKDARRILDDVLLSDFSDKNLPKALEFHGFAKPHEADKLATAIITKENRKVAAKEDRKASEHPVMKQAEQGADKAPEPPEADKPERPARPRLRQTNRKAAAMER
jgi:antirestriction protein ArdC